MPHARHRAPENYPREMRAGPFSAKPRLNCSIWRGAALMGS